MRVAVNTLGIDIGGTAVKAALVHDGVVNATGVSRSYMQPDLRTLQRAVRDAVGGATGDATTTSSSATPAASNSTSAQPLDAIGLCVPGIVDGETGTIRTAINVPSLVGVDPAQMVREAIELDDVNVWRFTDAHAAAHDLWDGQDHHDHQDQRMAAISIGTGVGLCVLDGGVPLAIGFGTPGHLGQIDVSLGETDAPVGPDGGRGGLEAYIGWPALRARYGHDRRDGRDGQDINNLAACLVADDTPLRALARAIRIVHAIYRPKRVVLLGGVGIAIKPCLTHLHSLVTNQLTSLAREGWTLETGDSLHHAASGAAKLAAAHAVQSSSP